MEHWAFEPEVLKVYAKHYKTGEVIPAPGNPEDDKSGKFNQGFTTVEYVAAATLDLDYYSQGFQQPRHKRVREAVYGQLGHHPSDCATLPHHLL